MSRNYKFHNPEGLYFISFATVFWIDVFVRRLYFDCLVENLNHCVDEKGMEIYAWCIMPSHVHLVFRSTIQKPEELIRDFKSFTSKKFAPSLKCAQSAGFAHKPPANRNVGGIATMALLPNPPSATLD